MMIVSPLDPIQVHVRMDRTITVTVDPQCTVVALKELMEGKDGIPVHYQCLVYQGRVLLDGMSLHELSIGNNATLHLTSGLFGGGKRSTKTQKKVVDVSSNIGKKDLINFILC